MPDLPPARRTYRRWWILRGALLASLLLELYCFTFGRSVLNAYVNPVGLLLSGLGLCWLTWQSARADAPALPASAIPRPGSVAGGRGGWRWWAVVLTLAAGWLRAEVPRFKLTLDAHPGSPMGSDILPLIHTYVQRWRWDDVVYRDFTVEIGYRVAPTYYPATWFPFVLADVLRFDYRWLALGALLVGIGAYWLTLPRRHDPLAVSVAKALWPLGVISAIHATEPTIFSLTAEPLIAGYYLVLGASLLTRSVVGRAVGLTGCLLSRWTLLLWVPLYAALVAWHERRRALALGALVAALVVGGYVWPFLRHDWTVPARALAYYIENNPMEWQRSSRADGLPTHVFSGVGLAPFFYHAPPGGRALTYPESLAAVAVVKRVQLGALGALLLGLAVWWWRGPGRAARWLGGPGGVAPDQLFALVSLKAYLIVFFATIFVPYAYLAIVSILFSTLLVGQVRFAHNR